MLVRRQAAGAARSRAQLVNECCPTCSLRQFRRQPPAVGFVGGTGWRGSWLSAFALIRRRSLPAAPSQPLAVLLLPQCHGSPQALLAARFALGGFLPQTAICCRSHVAPAAFRRLLWASPGARGRFRRRAAAPALGLADRGRRRSRAGGRLALPAAAGRSWSCLPAPFAPRRARLSPISRLFRARPSFPACPAVLVGLAPPAPALLGAVDGFLSLGFSAFSARPFARALGRAQPALGPGGTCLPLGPAHGCPPAPAPRPAGPRGRPAAGPRPPALRARRAKHHD